MINYMQYFTFTKSELFANVTIWEHGLKCFI